MNHFFIHEVLAVLCNELAWRNSRDTLEIASEERLGREIELVADALDVATSIVEQELDAEHHVLVDDVRGRKLCEFCGDGGQIFRRDANLVGIELHGAFLVVIVVEKIQELIEHGFLTIFPYQHDFPIGNLDVVEVGEIDRDERTEHKLLHQVVGAQHFCLLAQVNLLEPIDVFGHEMMVVETEAVVTDGRFESDVVVNVHHESSLNHVAEKDGTRLAHFDNRAWHDGNVVVGFHFDGSAIDNEIHTALHHRNDDAVVGIEE